MHAQTQAQHWQGGAPLPCSLQGPWPRLSMHELSLSMPEPMLSLSMTILPKSSDLGQRIWRTIRVYGAPTLTSADVLGIHVLIN